MLEAGLGFAVEGRQGRASSAAMRCCASTTRGLSRRLVQFRLTRPRAAPVPQRGGSCGTGEIVGILTSGNYGHALGGAVGLGYVPCAGEQPDEEILASTYEIEVAGRRHRGRRVSLAADVRSQGRSGCGHERGRTCDDRCRRGLRARARAATRGAGRPGWRCARRPSPKRCAPSAPGLPGGQYKPLTDGGRPADPRGRARRAGADRARRRRRPRASSC